MRSTWRVIATTEQPGSPTGYNQTELIVIQHRGTINEAIALATDLHHAVWKSAQKVIILAAIEVYLET